MKYLLITSILLLLKINIVYSSQNPVILQGFYWYIIDPGTTYEEPESNLWNLISQTMAPQFKKDGFTHVWLPPTYKSFNPNSQYSVGYSVYDRYDLGEFHQMGRVRTKYGTKQELINAVNALHNNGIQVIADIVMNHMLGADKFESVGYSVGFNATHPGNVINIGNGTVNAYTNFDFNRSIDQFPRKNTYSNFTWNKSHFDGLENYNFYYLFNGKSPDKVNYFGDLSSLPEKDPWTYKLLRSDIILGLDLDFQNIAVQEEMIRWTKWLIEEMGADGLRVDAIRHIHVPFLVRWANEIRTFMINRNPTINPLIFGESWDGWSDRLQAYLEGSPENNNLIYDADKKNNNYCGINNSMQLFDVPLHYDFQKIAKENFSYPSTRISDLPYRGLLSKRPHYTITFVDNHDTVPTQELQSYIPIHTKIQAYTFILLNEYGTPTVFYRDMYKGNFTSYYQNNYSEYLYSALYSLIDIRHKYAYGKGEYFTVPSMPGILGYKRSGDKNNPATGLIYLIREFDSFDNGLTIPTENRKWKLIAGSGYIRNGKFYLRNDDNYRTDWAVWAPAGYKNEKQKKE